MTIKHSSFFKAILQLTIGSAIGQLITLAASPVITRVYSVEDMGKATLVITIIAIFGPVINGKYDYAIVSTEETAAVSSLLAVGAEVMVLLTALVGVGLWGINTVFPAIFSGVGNTVYYTLPLLLSIGVTNLLTAFNNRQKGYQLMSQVYIKRIFFQNFFSILLGSLKFGGGGMLLAQLIGNLVGLGKQSRLLRQKKHEYGCIKKRDMWQVLKKYRTFPLYTLPAALVSSLSYSILNFFISDLFGLYILGIYSLTYRILGMPLMLISNNISKVFFKEAADEFAQTVGYLQALKKATFLLVAAAIPMVLILVFFSPILFALVFGEKWRLAGEYAQILAPMFGIRLIVSALMPAFIVKKKQHLELFFQSLFLVGSITCFFITRIFHLSINEFLIFFSVWNSLVYGAIYIYLLISGRKK